MKKLAVVSSTLFLLPLITFAQSANNIINLLNIAGDVLNRVIPLIIAITLIVFFWGLVSYVTAAGGGKGQENGKKIMIAGITALFVMVSIWGIIRLIQGTLLPNSNQGSLPPPQVQYHP
jgi:hypothetical protein